jgi:hypothetical protein
MLPSNPAGDGIARIRDAFRLEWPTIGWVNIEAVVAPISGASRRARRKIDLTDELGSRELRADARELITCRWSSLMAVANLTTQALFRFWWIDRIGAQAWSDECRDMLTFARKLSYLQASTLMSDDAARF